MLSRPDCPMGTRSRRGRLAECRRRRSRHRMSPFARSTAPGSPSGSSRRSPSATPTVVTQHPHLVGMVDQCHESLRDRITGRLAARQRENEEEHVELEFRELCGRSPSSLTISADDEDGPHVVARDRHASRDRDDCAYRNSSRSAAAILRDRPPMAGRVLRASSRRGANTHGRSASGMPMMSAMTCMGSW